MRKPMLFLCALFCLLFSSVNGQGVAVNTDGTAANASAMLDVKNTSKGMLIPRVALTSTGDVATIASPATSLMIYNTATAGSGATAVVPGFYYWNGSSWVHVGMTTTSTITGNNDLVVQNASGQVGTKKGYGAVALNYIIRLDMGTAGVFPSNIPGTENAGTLVGEIKLFAGTLAPTNWAFCNGQLLSIATYSDLFSLIGTTYGGDGVSTFALPDLRSAVPLQQGTSTSGKTWTLAEKSD